MIPPRPSLPRAQAASASFSLRYEDIAQDGRLVLETSMQGLSESVWKKLLVGPPTTTCFERGIVPILTRIVIEGTAGPFSVDQAMTADGAYELAHSVDERGAVARLHLNMWAELSAPIGRTYGTAPPRAGEPAVAARLFAEHTFTRLFAASADRKIVRFDVPGLPEVPPARYAAPPLKDLLEAPPGATALDETLVLDATPIAFGLCHTDSNQHVNSLVYPRLFEEAALRRLAAAGHPTALLARSLEIGFRKPCFAGQASRVALRTFALGDGRFGAAGIFVGEADTDLATARPHAYVRIILEP